MFSNPGFLTASQFKNGLQMGRTNGNPSRLVYWVRKRAEMPFNCRLHLGDQKASIKTLCKNRVHRSKSIGKKCWRRATETWYGEGKKKKKLKETIRRSLEEWGFLFWSNAGRGFWTFLTQDYLGVLDTFKGVKYKKYTWFHSCMFVTFLLWSTSVMGEEEKKIKSRKTQ